MKTPLQWLRQGHGDSEGWFDDEAIKVHLAEIREIQVDARRGLVQLLWVMVIALWGATSLVVALLIEGGAS